MANIKRLCYYHNKDLDGFFSGAVVKHKYPDVVLRGWDYKDPVPDISEIEGFDEIILIDITFPLEDLQYMAEENKITVIDHHISFKRQVDEYIEKGIKKSQEQPGKYVHPSIKFEYIFDQNLSACELGMKHYFGHIPPVVELVGKYDTWRAFGTEEWEEEVLPVKYYLYGKVGHPDDVISEWLADIYPHFLDLITLTGRSILAYERKMDEARTKSYAFETEAYGLRALCINTNFMSSETMISRFDPEKHDIQIGFAWNGRGWGVSLRSIEGGADASLIARERGGGGHKGAAGFEVKQFEDIFK